MRKLSQSNSCSLTYTIVLRSGSKWWTLHLIFIFWDKQMHNPNLLNIVDFNDNFMVRPFLKIS